MKKFFILLSILVFVLMVFIVQTRPPTTKSSVEINGKVFSIDVARTNKQKEEGLAIYDKLPEDKGMVFVFESPDYYSFWMKNMKFSIDIIFINKNKITDIYKNVLPPKNADDKLPTYKAREKSDIVLEINSGLSDKYNFKIGDTVKLNY